MKIPLIKAQFIFSAMCLALLCVCLPALSQVSALKEVIIHKSENDDRQYRFLKLKNNLNVLLISDPSADRAAAAMDVGIGSGDDPKGRQGLAHFLEHMLFLGTEKYPQADEYQTYLSQHAGSHNAFTSLEHTNFYFDIEPGFFQPMLDRFSQFFIAPSFDPEYVDRERNAVHSEYAAKIKDDRRRALDVYREIINPAHPLSTFSVGNLSTLDNAEGESLRNDLIEFYQRHYIAENMKLVVLGKEPLDELQQWVVPLFSSVASGASDTEKNNSKVVKTNRKEAEQVTLFKSHELPLQLEIKPERDQRYLKLFFPFPSVDEYYLEKPTFYLANLLGDEGSGSLFAVLKEQGWVEALSAGSYSANGNESFFQINIRLTKEGLAHYHDIAALAFFTIETIKNEGVDRWRFDELGQLNDIAFRFQEKVNPVDFVSSLAENLHDYLPEDVLSGDYAMDNFDSEFLQQLLGRMTLENLLLIVSAPEVETNKVSAFYQAPYKIEPLDVHQFKVQEALNEKIKLAPPNEFIPNNLSLKPRAFADEDPGLPQVPKLIKDASRMRVWFKQDSQYNVPLATTHLRIKSPAVAESVRGAVLMDLYAALIRDGLNEYAYPASLVGLDYALHSNNRGLDINIAGYNDGQGELFQRIVSALRNPRFQKNRFDIVRQELQLAWENTTKQPPYNQLLTYMPTLLTNPLWAEQEKLSALETITFDDVDNFAKQIFVDAEADMLLHGNLTRQEAIKLAALVEIDLLGAMAGKKLAPIQVLKISNAAKAALVTFPVEHSDVVATLFIQGRNDTVAEQARMKLLQQVVKTQFFHELRTERQLGYVVFSRDLQLKGVPGIQFLVQSPSVSASKLIEEMEAFNDRFISRLPVDLDLHKQALIAELDEKPKNLGEQSSDDWVEIVEEHFQFDSRSRLTAAINSFDDEEFNQFMMEVLTDPSRKLWLTSKALNTNQDVANEELEERGESGEELNIEAVESWAAYWDSHEQYVLP